MTAREPIDALTAEQLHTELVTDAVKRVATPLERFIPAVTRIAKLRGCTAEEAYLDIRSEVETLTGSPKMPML